MNSKPKTPAPEAIYKLVETFKNNLGEYRSKKNETELRREFLDKFFNLLGWDTDNNNCLSETKKEVVHEFSVEIAKKAKKADYAFRSGLRGEKFDFLVEAKKPHVRIETDRESAYQLRRYGWSAKLPINILTDFEHLAIYDCTFQPVWGDAVHIGRIDIIPYTEYIERWSELLEVFSPTGIINGYLANFTEKNISKKKKGTEEVDIVFLHEIERWRKKLAEIISLQNDVSLSGLNYSVQMIIDRIIFLRICEERGIEPDFQLLNLIEKKNIYQDLCLLFKKADTKYNSGLFHFEEEKGSKSQVDNITLDLKIDDRILKDIISNLYYPKSPYAFLYIPSDILGQVYERFLGKEVQRTKGNHVQIGKKGSVRKEHGIYYTPTYIVNRIVKNTIGKILENKNPEKVALLKIVDPACGSGNFLLGAFQFLIDWHLSWYLENNIENWEKNKTVIKTTNGYVLSIAKKKEILKNNIYGVDIDTQAVEVTKLSLLLKILENVGEQAELGLERVLPDLGSNIKCGNSLIDFDYVEKKSMEGKEIEEINPFDWKIEFKEIFSKGGFNVVIGNPPYIRPHNIPERTKEALWEIYSTFIAKSDMYSCFMEKGLSILKEGGLFSFIVPHTWTSLESFTKIRKLFIQNSKIIKLVQLPKKVFADATVETCMFVIEKNKKSSNSENLIIVEKLDENEDVFTERTFVQREIEESHLYNFQLYGKNESKSIISKIQQVGKPLSSSVNLAYGFKTGDDEQFIHLSKKYKESKPFTRSAGVYRYWIEEPSEYVWYVPEKMTANRKTARPGDIERFESEKIIVSRMGKSLVASYDSGGLYVKDAMLLLKKEEENLSLKYFLGIINSKLMTYYYQKFFITIDVLKNALLSLPIAPIELSNHEDRLRYDKIVSLVEKMLLTQKNVLLEQATPHEKENLKRQVEYLEENIDNLIYELYGLSDDEKDLVRNS